MWLCHWSGMKGAGDFGGEPVCDAVIRFGRFVRHVRRRDDDVGAVGPQQVDLFLRHLVGHDQDAAVAADRGRHGEARSGVAAGRLDDRRAGLAASRASSASRSIATAGRSLTLPPGIDVLDLGQDEARARRRSPCCSRISGVRPTASRAFWKYRLRGARRRVGMGRAPGSCGRISKPARSPLMYRREHRLELHQRGARKWRRIFVAGTDFPRRGREEIDGFLWLCARLRQGARGRATGRFTTTFTRVRWTAASSTAGALPRAQFDAALETCTPTPRSWHGSRRASPTRSATRRTLAASKRKARNMDRQDAEEGVVAA